LGEWRVGDGQALRCSPPPGATNAGLYPAQGLSERLAETGANLPVLVLALDYGWKRSRRSSPVPVQVGP
jgi:hypothetical protein